MDRNNHLKTPTRQKMGFTLIELLVVIAIIALLLSILMPGLQKAKEQAKNIICRTNLKNWGTVIKIYTNDHNDRFWPGNSPAEMGTAERWKNALWQGALRQYYEADDFRICPAAPKPRFQSGAAFDSGGQYIFGSTTLGWGMYSQNGPFWANPGDLGSYGCNGYIMDGKLGSTSEGAWVIEQGLNWPAPTMKEASQVPLFMDMVWSDMWCFPEDNPPDNEDDMDSYLWSQPNYNGEMSRVTLRRHNAGINILFCDLSARHSGITYELWNYKWHQKWSKKTSKAANAYPWPEWMLKP